MVVDYFISLKPLMQLIDSVTFQELLVMHKFKNISEYYSKGSRFQMTVGTVMKNDFICETSQVRARLLISFWPNISGRRSQYTLFCKDFEINFLLFQAKTMEDLLSSYIIMYEKLTSFVPRNSIFFWGFRWKRMYWKAVIYAINIFTLIYL